MVRYRDAIVFAALWTLAMIIWAWPVGIARAAIMTLCGAMAGASFQLMIEWWAERQSRRGS